MIEYTVTIVIITHTHTRSVDKSPYLLVSYKAFILQGMVDIYIYIYRFRSCLLDLLLLLFTYLVISLP